MKGWLIGLCVAAILVVLLELKNRRERPLYQKLEESYKELLEGRFQNEPVMRRRFMRALARYVYHENGHKMALAMFATTSRRTQAKENRMACILMIGICFEDAGQWGDALKAYDAVCREEPFWGMALKRRAHLLSRMKDPACVDAYEQVIRRYPGDAVQYNNFGSALYRVDRYEEAVEKLRYALELDDTLHSARGVLAMVYAYMGDEENAAKAFQDAVDHGQNAEELRNVIEQELEYKREQEAAEENDKTEEMMQSENDLEE
ncbi:MAG: hypothetical protein IJZ85_10185 [Lachnospiraceae bacterium]|nr:hypothetical protein [Lachnospiraceae bacterium]